MQTAFIFPGQGSQSLGMMSEFHNSFGYAKTLIEEANDALGYDIWNIITSDENSLNKTVYTQPAMLLANSMSLRVLQHETDIVPHVTAGHSLGELAALVASEVVDFATAIVMVDKRAKLMQECVPEGIGGMAAILGLDDAVVLNVCAELSQTSGVVEAVNFNAPGQVVIAGHTQAVATACEKLKEQGAKRALVLPVSVPSHSSLMKSAGEEFLAFMNDYAFASPSVPVLHNVDAMKSTLAQEIKEKLALQLYNPVKWVATITNMSEIGVTRCIEVGPGKVFTGLNKRIDKTLSSHAIFDIASLEAIQNSAV